MPITLCFCIWIATVLYTILCRINRTEMVAFIALITIQLISSINDLYNRTISLKLIYIGMLIGLVGFLLSYDIDTLRNHILGCLAAFITMLLLILLSKNQIGGGDLWLMTVTGLFVGNYAYFSILFVCILLAGLYSVVLLLLRKGNRKTELPFAPFIFVATVICMLGNGC